MNHTTRACIITIGDELLIGQIIDTNSAWIAQELNKIGIHVERRIAIADNKEAILKNLEAEIPHAELVLITGGLGPTADDVTKPSLCAYFDGKLIVDESVLEHVKQIFLSRKKPLLERNLKQAEVPDVCQVIPNRYGTAPGMLFEQNGHIIVSMPGVPFEMKGMMQETLLPLFREKFQRGQNIMYRNILTFGEGESFLAERIQDIENSLPAHIRLAYLPSPFAVKLRLSGSGPDATILHAELDHFQQQIASCLEPFVISLVDEAIEQQICTLMRAQQITLGLAESCTGGYIGHKITQINGSSQYFKGSAVCYATESKSSVLGIPEDFIKKHGVVSKEIAGAMAEQAAKIFKSDIGLGITGIFSDSPYEDKSPVGTVHIGLYHARKKETFEYKLRYDRLQNKETAAQVALYLVWNFAHSLQGL